MCSSPTISSGWWSRPTIGGAAGLNLMRAMGLKLDANIELTDKLDYRPAEVGTLDDALSETPASFARN